MSLQSSNLEVALARIAKRSASAAVARARVASPGLNAALLRRLSVLPGERDSMLADPVFETAKTWKTTDKTLGDFSPDLLDESLVAAMDRAESYPMAKSCKPYVHQHAAWQAIIEDEKSVLVTSGTGSGKTECFLIPLLNDLVNQVRPGGGVQAILLYPLNALIESQRERLLSWTKELDGKVKFALYNGDTPETARKAGEKSTNFELRNRKDIRNNPPDILVTNITMLEYLLLREQDRTILETSKGALRWIVLDEAHTYVGSQAAEMALLLRRVRAAFGVEPSQVRLIATSATISGEKNREEKLKAFTADLAGIENNRVTVIEGEEDEPQLPTLSADTKLDVKNLNNLGPEEIWHKIASHPRCQTLRRSLDANPLQLGEIARILFNDSSRRNDAQSILDKLAIAEQDGRNFLPWRAHIFHRSQGGVFACVDSKCKHRDSELIADEGDWPFGSVYLNPRPSCECGAPVFEVVTCDSCGIPFLQAQLQGGAKPRLMAPEATEGDDFALDAEPEEDDALENADTVLICSQTQEGAGYPAWVEQDSGNLFDNLTTEGTRLFPISVIEQSAERHCCDSSKQAKLQPLRFGPAFFLGNSIPQALEFLADPLGAPGLPSGGRRALSFTDSRQGVARLSAKLQQEAERSLTRSFIWHASQEKSKGSDPAEIAKVKKQLHSLQKLQANGEEGFDDLINELRQRYAELSGSGTTPVLWGKIVQKFSEQEDLKSFAGDIWHSRNLGERLASNPFELAQMFLFRELFRRPKVQNNPETMGLTCLVFPELEKDALSDKIPGPLQQSGVDGPSWYGLVMTTLDYLFRDPLATQIPEWMVPIVLPRFGKLNAVVKRGTKISEMSKNAKVWPDPVPKTGSRPTRIHTLIYKLINGDMGCPQDQDQAGEVLEAIWSLITRNAACDTGMGNWRLDFNRAALTKFKDGYLCPISRRPYGYSMATMSPFDPSRKMTPVSFPDLPHSNSGGLTPAERREVAEWAEHDPTVADLRKRGLWSDLHDRIATYPSFLRSQEHSAQIERKVLRSYEEQFNEGRINLLNCSTTMEMGVDLDAVQLIINTNVPPSLSNYRQRVGRAGRRGEPWAFGLTFCRDLPLDRQAYLKPKAFLSRPISTPKVWFDSPPLVRRHVNAAVLGVWFAGKGGISVKANTGSFLGVDVNNLELGSNAIVDQIITDIGGEWGKSDAVGEIIRPLVKGTVLDSQDTGRLVEESRDALDRFVVQWRREYRDLIDRMQGTDDRDVAKAFELRAKRMSGEFLLGDLARRGVTPAYGFPTDVVSFDPLVVGRTEDEQGISYRQRGKASRQLHQAIREYAPGSEVVIDGLVYECDGVRPAWGGESDTSKLEDFQELWECSECHAFGMSKSGTPEFCPDCESRNIKETRVLRPAGFLSGKRPHTGYEALLHSPYKPPMVSAQATAWTTLPDPDYGRYRHDPEGFVVSRSGGKYDKGYAICLDCGRAESVPKQTGIQPEIPNAIRKHRPLAKSRNTKLTQDGYCPGGYTDPNRIQRNIYLAQISRTDVFEFQFPQGISERVCLALIAALRAALCERLGVEIDEIGVSVGKTRGPGGETRSGWLYDQAAGGAGLVARLNEIEMLSEIVTRAGVHLDCQDKCKRGCPSCILVPDLSLSKISLDRPGALNLAKEISSKLKLPLDLKVFGEDTRQLGMPLPSRLDQVRRNGSVKSIALFLHGTPDQWDFPGWAIGKQLPKFSDARIQIALHISSSALAHAGFDLGAKLALYRLGELAKIYLQDDLPVLDGKPLIATVQQVSGETIGIAATHDTETVPGPEWGLGTLGPLLSGTWSNIPKGTLISVKKIMEFGTGNGRILSPENKLNGPVQGFGKRFWSWLGKEMPLEISAMQKTGLKSISYSDRYLLTPLNLLMLSKVIYGLPSGTDAQIQISIAPIENRGGLPSFPKIFHAFNDDRLRVDVLKALMPDAEVSMATQRKDLPHRREFVLTLKDERIFRVLLDQGFGAWRCFDTNLQYEFSADPTKQASHLKSSKFTIKGGDEPVIWENVS